MTCRRVRWRFTISRSQMKVVLHGTSRGLSAKYPASLRKSNVYLGDDCNLNTKEIFQLPRSLMKRFSARNCFNPWSAEWLNIACGALERTPLHNAVVVELRLDFHGHMHAHGFTIISAFSSSHNAFIFVKQVETNASSCFRVAMHFLSW